MEAALYDEEAGFYAAGRGAGRARDFLTSPEIGPLFGAVIARALDSWWDELGRPDPFVVVEAGAGSGALAASVIGAGPRCASSLRYVLVERSAARREEHAARLALEPPALVLGPTVAGDGDDAGEGEARHPAPGSGPLATSLAELPAVPVTGVVLANELLDNLPFQLCERRAAGWHEVLVGESQGDLVEVAVLAPENLAEECQALAPDAPEGARIPIQREAARWLRAALDVVAAGRLVLVDYASTTAEMATRPETGWMRTYHGHGRGGDALAAPGAQDITAEVAVDQLERVRPPARVSDQASFLDEHGLADLVADARAAWTERAHVGDLAALASRSRMGEGQALADPTGLGAFAVLEWIISP
jgi:SAM-dependent MidA family methyltransferase